MISKRTFFSHLFWLMGLCALISCQNTPASSAEIPTLMAVAVAELEAATATPPGFVPPTYTAVPLDATIIPTPSPPRLVQSTPTPAILPTITPIPPTLTPSITPTPTITPTATIKPLADYRLDEPLPPEAYPRPQDDNGWGMHWIPTVSQEPAVVDRFVGEMVRMHIKWVVFLNDGTNIGNNDYLVDRLVANGIMPVMRLYRSNVTIYEGDLGKMVAHYRARGVYYYQLYNEPNVNEENNQGAANPSQYATMWAVGARDVIANGGFPGFGSMSPGGAFNHYLYLERVLQALKHNGDAGLLNRAWLSVHNYHGTRPYDDPDGFLMFRNYDQIIQKELNRSPAYDRHGRWLL
ncbi:MAG: hypothetical protein IPL78_02195 [Chloroflexi bacterium]|nr:hypothetical protein [Chloroflexota bacterium]